MTLSGFRVLDKSAVCFLFVVSGKGGPQGRKLHVGFQPAKALLGFVHSRRSPTQGHRGRTPALHIAGDETHGAHHIFDDVGAGRRAPQLCRQTEPAQREDLIQSPEDALRDAGASRSRRWARLRITSPPSPRRRVPRPDATHAGPKHEELAIDAP